MAAKRTIKSRVKKTAKPAGKAKRTAASRTVAKSATAKTAKRTTAKRAGAKTVRTASAASKKSVGSSAGTKRTLKKKAKRPTARKATTSKAATSKAAASTRKTASSTGRATRIAAAPTAKKKTITSRASRSRSKASATSQDPIQFPEEKPLPKTKLTAKELRGFKKLLLGKRAELVGDVRRLSDGALKRNGDGNGEHATMPIHMADVGSDNWEQEFTLGLVATEQAVVREIDDALKRIADRTYGVCVATREPISTPRLLAKPWAKYCIEYARAREEGRAI